MPYITGQRQYELQELKMGMRKSGDLSWKQTRDILDFLMEQEKVDYDSFCRAVGATVLTIFEVWWRKVRPYEDKKCAENGDVF